MKYMDYRYFTVGYLTILQIWGEYHSKLADNKELLSLFFILDNYFNKIHKPEHCSDICPCKHSHNLG